MSIALSDNRFIVNASLEVGGVIGTGKQFANIAAVPATVRYAGKWIFDFTLNKQYQIDADGVTAVEKGILTASQKAEIIAHLTDTDNPHQVDKGDVGLANVDNTSDIDKPVSTAQAAADDLRILISHIIDNLTSTDTDKPLSANQGYVLKGLIDAITIPGIVDNLTTQEAGQTLSANQGYVLKALIDAITIPTIVDNLTTQEAGQTLSANQGYALKALIDARVTTEIYTTGLATKIDKVTGSANVVPIFNAEGNLVAFTALTKDADSNFAVDTSMKVTGSANSLETDVDCAGVTGIGDIETIKMDVKQFDKFNFYNCNQNIFVQEITNGFDGVNFILFFRPISTITISFQDVTWGEDLGDYEINVGEGLLVNAYQTQGVIVAIAIVFNLERPGALVPTLSTFSLDGGAATTTDEIVDLNQTSLGEPTHFMVSENSDFFGASWQLMADWSDFTLSRGNETKTVYCKLKNAYGESGILSDSIVMDIPVPTITINSVDITSLPDIIINSTITGAIEMRVDTADYDGELTDSDWLLLDIVASNQAYEKTVSSGMFVAIRVYSYGNEYATYYFQFMEDIDITLTLSSYNGFGVSEYGASDGAATVVVNSGNGPFTFLWETSNGSGLVPTDQNQTGLTAGNYSCSVYDALGNFGTEFLTITSPSQMVVSADITDASTFGGSDGAIDLTPTGGVPPYTFNWDNTEETEDLTGLTAGDYTVVITDVNGAELEDTFTVGEPVNPDPPLEGLQGVRYESESVQNDMQVELNDQIGVAHDAQGGRCYDFDNNLITTPLDFSDITYLHWEVDFRKPTSAESCFVGQVVFSSQRIELIWFTNGKLYFHFAGGTGTESYVWLTDYDVWVNIKVIFDGAGATNADKVKFWLDGVPQSVVFLDDFPTAMGTLGSTLAFGADPYAGMSGLMANFKNFDSAGNLLNWYKCDEKEGTDCYDCVGLAHGTIDTVLAGFHTEITGLASWADTFGYTEDSVVSGRNIPIRVDATGEHLTLDIAGNTPTYLGPIGTNIEITSNPCIEGNGTSGIITFNFAGVADITSVTIRYYDGAAWQTVTDAVGSGSSITGLWRITGTQFDLLFDGTDYFASMVSELVCKDVGENEIIHSNFAETSGLVAYNRARATRDGDGVLTDVTHTVDDGAYPVALLKGFDRWQNINTLTDFVDIPYNVDETALLTQGGTLTDHLWYSNHPPIAGYVFHNKATSKMRAIYSSALAALDTGNQLIEAGGTPIELSFADLQDITINPLYLKYGGLKLQALAVYSETLSGANLTEANTWFDVKVPDKFVFAGDSQTLGYNNISGWDFPNMFVDRFNNKTTITVSANLGRETNYYSDDPSGLAALYDATKNRNIAVIMLGNSDASSTSPVYTAQNIYDNLKIIWAAMKASGFIVVVIPVLPCWNIITKAGDVNTLIMSDDTLYDLVVAPADYPELYSITANETDYYRSDHVHMSEKGNMFMTQILLSLIPE
ncbi:MAG: hypothetical protein K9H62_12435 [Bacteroidales bacterium]|nr:hypothetical protein [Bacteroidales bacterium]